ncbi:UDP-N-acetylglucosamine 1-carboxyvinyltransferase [Lyticum sinuosum]|uniref:UDP-N-acetylglucosamine 1-carboxyvinyltransferase n=1 Tax=Lyticum sinuosum TaxID=1332059 RepID=A0AAE5AHH3_9RICK|nr:UDP-N-acetylglucosamine 1-carboxyvinyltransferase [Lyticum sinuosum]MDZ5761026.1 UDP-N-acetylglucosamine 1-carboxyvinyltransferase 2 [Lyticum sinuosum]
MSMPEYNLHYEITGGEPIYGDIHCMGAKNLATKVMIAAILGESTTTLYNVPSIGDVDITVKMLRSIGADISWENNVMKINPKTVHSANVLMPDSRTNRIPILLLSILLQKFDHVVVPHVGGDKIGERNITFHIEALKSFGASIVYHDNSYKASKNGKLRKSHINLPYPSVGATETCIFLGVLAKGTSVIKNVAIEPEIIELITMLSSMGAIIIIGNNREITIHGVDRLFGTEFTIIGDRIEAVSWASLAGASDGKIRVSGIKPGLLCNFYPYYQMAGCGYTCISDNIIEFFRKKKLSPVSIETDVYPGFATDWQQTFAIMLTQAEGISVIHETVHDNRMSYLKVITELGANVQSSTSCLGSVPCRYRSLNHEHSAIIAGKTHLKSIKESIKIPDLRAGLAYVIAAAVAEGKTILSATDQIHRGYGNLTERLKNTNLKIKVYPISE